VRLLERHLSRQLQVQRDLGASVGSQHGKIVDLAHLRHALRRRERALAESRLVLLGLDVDDDVALRQRFVKSGLDGVSRGVALADRGARRDADDDIGELLRPSLAHPQPP
jgi:hypothetical protein